MDTIRTLAELNALLADNVAADISPQDLRDLMISQMVHAEIGSGAKASGALSAGWNTLDLNVDGVAKRGADTDLANHRITSIPVEMKATLTYDVSFKGVAGQTYEFTVWTNSEPTPVQINRVDREERILNGTQVGKVFALATVQLSADDTLELAVKSATNDFELLFAVMRVQRIGVE